MELAARRMFEVQPPAVVIKGHNFPLILSRQRLCVQR
jgi:hypothetical protein